MENIEDLKKNEHKIGKAYVNEDRNLVRIVDGKEIIQIEEKTEEDIRMNNVINLWRMRAK